jgi:hypothetical protein
MAAKGRYWAAAWLLAFLGAAWIVIARQTSAIRTARALAALREERADLEGRRADFERRIRAAESRAVLVHRARDALGLRLPADTEIILLPAPGAEPR